MGHLDYRATYVAVGAMLAGLGAGWLLWGRDVPRQGGGDRKAGASGVSMVADLPAAPQVVPEARSLFSIPIPTMRVSRGGIAAGTKVLEYLQTRDPAACTQAAAAFAELEERENHGGEYSTLRWFCTWAAADATERARMRAENRDGDRFLRWFEKDDFASLSEYLNVKYLGHARSREQFRFVDDLVRFNGPLRHEWERTDEMLDWIGFRPGQVVADIGSGPGYVAFRIAERVGASGKVYAVETDRGHLAYLHGVVKEDGLANVVPVESDGTGTGLPPQSVDVAYLSLTYQAIYGISSRAERLAFVQAVRRTLRPGGRLVVVEAVPEDELEPGVAPYMGWTVSRDLVEPQLAAFGWKLVKSEKFVPQRYVLVFEDGAAPVPVANAAPPAPPAGGPPR